jgi:2-dehydropantoate 2-reductase
VKIAIVGAGAIGGYLGGWLSASGEDVTFIARGKNLEAISARGMTVVGEDGKTVHATNARVFERMADAGAQDFVLLTVKAHQVGDVAGDLKHLCNADTAIVTMQNGIPWWYFQKHGQFSGRSVEAADPDGTIAKAVNPSRIIGSVVYPAAVLEAPGVVRVVEGKRFTLGELDGSATPRIERISAVLNKAGFKSPVSNDIRSEIWLKVLGNLAFNPISALTHATLADLLKFPPTRELCIAMMREAESVATKLGVTMRVGIEKRIAGAEKVGAHKTSMLQDVEAGRALEHEALVGAVAELGRVVGITTPHIDSVLALMRLLAKSLADSKGKLVVS